MFFPRASTTTRTTERNDRSNMSPNATRTGNVEIMSASKVVAKVPISLGKMLTCGLAFVWVYVSVATMSLHESSLADMLAPSSLLLESRSSRRAAATAEHSHTYPDSDVRSFVQQVQADSDFKCRQSNNLVHVIQTRFMQFQPSLLHLGRARLEIFKRITMPSLAQQSCREFMWILRVDPDLEHELRSKLLNGLEEAVRSSNFTLQVVVLASNDNPEGFRSVEYYGSDLLNTNSTDIITKNKPEAFPRVLFGDAEMLRAYWRASQTRLVLETRLDADDALSLDFVELLQREASRYGELQSRQQLKQHQDYSDGTSMQQKNAFYKVFCVYSHVEWQHYNPWRLQQQKIQPVPQRNLTSSSSAGIGINRDPTITTRHQLEEEDTRGGLVGARPRHCVTPGLTVAYPPGVSRRDMRHPSNHQRLHRYLPWCAVIAKARPGHSSNRTACLQYVTRPGFVGAPMALRVRTVTSAGMNNLVLSEKNHFFRQQESGDLVLDETRLRRYRDLQTELFRHLPSLFGVRESEIRQMRTFIEADKQAILKDALKGQCTRGHSCKAESKMMLRALLNAAVMNTTTTVSKR